MTNLFESAINGVEKKAAQVGGAIADEAHKALSAVAAPIDSAAKSAQMQVAGLLPHLSLSGGHDGHSPPQSAKLHAADSTAHPQATPQGHLLQNLLDIGGTIATGIGEDVKKDIKGAESKVYGAVEATEKAAVEGGTWIGHHPVESAVIAAGAVAAVGATIATAGLAAPLIAEGAAAVGAAAEGAGVTEMLTAAIPAAVEFLGNPLVQQGVIGLTALVPIAGTYHAVHETMKNGELKVLMNQQNESKQAVDRARGQLKHDTSRAALNDGAFVATLGVGVLGAKAIQTWGPKLMEAILPAETVQESGLAGGASVQATADVAPATAEATPSTETTPAAKRAENSVQRIVAIFDGIGGDLAQIYGYGSTVYATTGKLFQAVPGYAVAAPDTHNLNPSNDESSKHSTDATSGHAATGHDGIYIPDETTHFTMPDARLTF
jgi:hypothetical protein